jgi:hypothetical protein
LRAKAKKKIRFMKRRSSFKTRKPGNSKREANGSEEFFSIERLKRKPKNYLPYNFVLKTFSWTEKECEKAGKIVFTR